MTTVEKIKSTIDNLGDCSFEELQRILGVREKEVLDAMNKLIFEGEMRLTWDEYDEVLKLATIIEE